VAVHKTAPAWSAQSEILAGAHCCPLVGAPGGVVDTHNSQSGDLQHRVRIDAAAATACGVDSGGGGPRFARAGLDRVRPGWLATRLPACNAFCSRKNDAGPMMITR